MQCRYLRNYYRHVSLTVVEIFTHPIVAQYSRYRIHATGESLAQYDEIGPLFLVVDGESVPGSAEACLDFVRDPQNIVFRAQISHALQISILNEGNNINEQNYLQFTVETPLTLVGKVLHQREVSPSEQRHQPRPVWALP